MSIEVNRRQSLHKLECKTSAFSGAGIDCIHSGAGIDCIPLLSVSNVDAAFRRALHSGGWYRFELCCLYFTCLYCLKFDVFFSFCSVGRRGGATAFLFPYFSILFQHAETRQRQICPLFY